MNSRWSILAAAFLAAGLVQAAGEDRLGTDQTHIASPRDLRIVSGLAPVVRQGDRASAYFTVRNGSNRVMRVEVTARRAGPEGRLPAHSLELAGGEARELAWPSQVPADDTELEWLIEAREIGGPARDTLKARQRVEPVVPVRVQSSTLYRLDKQMDLEITPPEGALSGEVRATFAASLTDGQGAVRDHMRRYPYSCLEQKVSRAVATRDERAWDELMEALPGQLDEQGLARFFPGLAEGDVALTAYILSISHEAGWQLPAHARVRMLKGLEDYVSGRIEQAARPWLDARALLALRMSALEALSRHGRATPALLSIVKPEPELWPTTALIDWLSLLKRSPQVADRDVLLRAAQDVLRARLYFTGRRLTFGQEAQESFWWMMSSPDTNAMRALLTVMDLPQWQMDVPRLVMGALARQSRGHWNSTTANAWGALAMERYSLLYEADKPNGLSFAWLGREGRFVDWWLTPRGATAFFTLPPAEGTLKLMHQGAGQPYLTVSTLAAVPLKAPVHRGLAIKREITAVKRKTPERWSRGDVLRVRLTIDSREDMGWVVVEDPLPAGASILGSGHRRALRTGSEQHPGHAWPAWEERLPESYRAYYEYLPHGQHSLEYTLRLDNDGVFQLPPTRVEAMYAPEVYAEAPNAPMEVVPWGNAE